MKAKKRLLFVINTPGFFLSHRLPLAIAARECGFDVHIATGAGAGADAKKISSMGFEHHAIPLSRSGINPALEMVTLWSLFRLFIKLRPDLLHLVTIKPVLYGGLMARLIKIPAVVVAISGLGTLFVSRERGRFGLRSLVEKIYRMALAHPNLKVIFQNPDDRSTLISIGAVKESNSVIIRGSGVSVDQFTTHPEPEGIPIVTLAARLLKDKGVREFVAAAVRLKERGINARFLLAGSFDRGNPTAITEFMVNQWVVDNSIEFLGHADNIASLFSMSNIIVLPSYREGLPKVLLEAAASGRAVVTTDVPGCRDAIEPGLTGLLVPPRDSFALADAIQSLILDPERRRTMGKEGRALAEREFTIGTVVRTHLAIYNCLLSAKPTVH